MKRRVISILLAAVLTASLFAIPASAASTYLFLFNDEFWEMSASTPPVIIRGQTCMPMEKLLSRLKGSFTYDDTTKTLTIYRANRIFNFNFDTGYCTTDTGEAAYAPAFYQNGSYYLPMEYIAEQFGYRFFKVSDNIYRFQTQSGKYTNEQYARVFASKTSPDQTEYKAPNFYLVFDDQPNSSTESILDALRSYSMTATFFMTEANMRSMPDLVRKIIVSGNSVGLQPAKNLYSTSPDKLLQSVESANTTLEKITKQRTVLIMPVYGRSDLFTDAARSLLVKNSYRIYEPTVNLPEYNAYESVSVTKNEFATISPLLNWNCVVRITAKKGLSELIGEVASRQATGDYHLYSATEMTDPINYWNDYR